MTAPEQQATDPRQPAWDAVFAYIRTLSRDALPGSIVERNAVIWRAVNAALVALGYPDADTQQAAPEQADLRQRIDATIRPRMLIGLQDAELYDEPGRERIGEWADSITSWVLAALQSELAELAALRERLAAAERPERGTRMLCDCGTCCDECGHYDDCISNSEEGEQ